MRAYKGLFIEGAMLLLPFDVGKPWLNTAGIAEQILFVHGILISLQGSRSARVVAGCLNGRLRSGKSPAGTQMFGPSVRAAGVISGAGASLALRHSVRAGSNRTDQQNSIGCWRRKVTQAREG